MALARELPVRAAEEVRRRAQGAPRTEQHPLSVAQETGRFTNSPHKWLGELLDPPGRSLRAALAYPIKLAFETYWDLARRLADIYLDRWCSWAADSGSTHHRRGEDHYEALGRHPPPVPLEHHQRHARRERLPRPSRQAQGRTYRTTENFISDRPDGRCRHARRPPTSSCRLRPSFPVPLPSRASRTLSFTGECATCLIPPEDDLVGSGPRESRAASRRWPVCWWPPRGTNTPTR